MGVIAPVTVTHILKGARNHIADIRLVCKTGNMKKRLFLACMIGCINGGAIAQDRLAPADKQEHGLETYRELVRRVLGEAFAPDVKARVIVEPSFQPELAIGLRQRGASFELFSIRPTKHIWNFQLLDMMKTGKIQTLGPSSRNQEAEIKKLEAGLPNNPEQIPLKRCKVSVEQSIAKTILSAWSHMLQNIAPDDEAPFGLDGESYYFSMPVSDRELMGQTWSPRQGSRADKFVRMSFAMRDFCQSQRDSDLQTISSLAKQIVED